MSDIKNAQASSTSSGNTKARASAPRSRKFMVTFWEKKDILWDASKMIYACQCDDKCSEEHDGKWHGHYFVYYKHPRTWKEIKQHYGNTAHIEYGSQIKSNSGCIDYIMGRGNHAESKSNMIEFGKQPCDNGQHITVRDALNMSEDDVRTLDVKDALNVMKIKNQFDEGIEIDDWKKEVKVTFITGPSGIGKTEKVKEIIRNESETYGTKVHIIKYESSFYHGTGNGQGIAIYDDFRDSHMPASEFINLIDYNTHSMNIKGGSQTNNFTRIFITSVQNPHEIYSKMADEPRKQWLRRMEIIDLTPAKSENDDLAELLN